MKENASNLTPNLLTSNTKPEDEMVTSYLKEFPRSCLKSQTVQSIELMRSLKGCLPSTTQDQESMHVAIRPYILLGQCFGLVPVSGILRSGPQDLRFSWRSKRVLYAVILILATIMMAAVGISSSVVLRGLTYKNIVDLISLILSVAEIIFCLQQGQNWPSLIMEWSSVEQKMNHIHSKIGLNRKIKVLVFSYFIGAVILVVAQVSNYMHMLRRCSQDSLELMKLAVVAMYYPLFSLLGVSTLTMTLLIGLTMHHYILVIYDELTITVLSFCLATKFRQLNKHLVRYQKQRLPCTYWAKMREAYNGLSLLAKKLDSHLSHMTFMCFGANLYYICSQLLDMLSGHKKNTWASTFMLLFTFTRTFLAALAASYIAEDSKKPLALLFSVDSESYNIEVCRFQMQVTHDEIAITGCNYFSVTRSFILTVAGTILTYEIVLLQFGNIALETSGSTNKTRLCLKVMALVSN